MIKKLVTIIAICILLIACQKKNETTEDVDKPVNMYGVDLYMVGHNNDGIFDENNQAYLWINGEPVKLD